MTTNPRYANGARRRTIRARVLARDELCWLCKLPVDKTLTTPHPGSPEVHELLPISRGGSPYDPKNTVLCHKACNRWISDRTPEELMQGRRQVRPTVPVPTSRQW